jgi:glycine cleavage system H lipoate-binding protein
VNESLRDNPEPINNDPYGKGWLITIHPSDLSSELGNLMNFDAAVKYHQEVVKKG